jgi:predicted GH43/DUF377 family glycosyl hydrolase
MSVEYRNGQFKMLYRGQDASGLSQTGYASSTDGLSFTRYAGNPVIKNDVPNYDTGNVQDPRFYELNGTYYSFFTGQYGYINLMEATSSDGIHWNTAVPIVRGNKNAAVLTDPNDTPVLRNTQYGPRYVMYYGQHGDGSYIA